MYPITAAAKTAFRAGGAQLCRITVTNSDGTQTLTEADIKSGGMSINRYCSTSGKLDIGSCVAAELTLRLNNVDGRYNSIQFEGAEMYVEVGVKVSGSNVWIPMGYFTCDTAPRKLSTITISALDRMVQFDKTVADGDLTFPCRVYELFNTICSKCNITSAETDAMKELPNGTYQIPEAPDDSNMTYRQILAWLCQMTGTCAYMDYQGHLAVSWYAASDDAITASVRTTSDLYENAVTVTGIQYETDDTVYLSGAEGYVLDLDSNSLIQSDYETVIGNIGGAINGFSCTPFSATLLPTPHLWPLDVVSFVDAKNVSHSVAITSVTFTLNANTKVSGAGETKTSSGYASANPLTSKEVQVLDALKKNMNKQLTARQQAAIDMNALVANALGLYRTDIVNDDGSTTYYMHDQSTLEDSGLIYKFDSSGIAWTRDGWNSGSPTWSYGVLGSGDAFFRRISADQIETGTLSTERLDLNAIIQDSGAGDRLTSVESWISANADAFQAKFSSIDSTLNDYAQDISTLQLTSNDFTLNFKKIEDDGVSKVTTSEMGYTFNDEGLTISKPGEQLTNKIDNTGMRVYITVGDVTEDRLIANAEGVVATNLTARNYLNIGAIRFEPYGSTKTAIYYTGG